MTDVTIQIDGPLTPEEVVKLRQDGGWDGSLEEWQQCLKQNMISVSARDANGELVGVGFLSGTVRHAEIVDLVVQPDHRKHGIGEALLEQLIKYAKQKGIRYLGLTYDKKSPWLRDFYEKHGFKSIDFAMWHEDSLS